MRVWLWLAGFGALAFVAAIVFASRERPLGALDPVGFAVAPALLA